METVTLHVTGMSCAGCAQTIERAIASQPGVQHCTVNFAVNQARVVYEPKMVKVDQVQKAIANVGYSAEPLVLDLLTHQNDESASTRSDRGRSHAPVDEGRIPLTVRVGLVLSLILMIGTMPMMLGVNLPFIPKAMHHPWTQFILATPIQFWCGFQFYRHAWKAFKRRTATMDTLVVLGTSVAYGYSVVATLWPQMLKNQGIDPVVYFESSAVIITLILLGRWLEQRAKRQTTSAIRALMELQAPTARLMKDGETQEVPVEAIALGDVVLVKPGEKIPVDGKVVEGRSSVD